MKKKTILIISIIVICCIGGVVGIILFNKNNTKTEEPNTPKQETIYNTNEKVVEDKNINDITFTNIECKFDGNNSLLTYTITNNKKESITLGEYEIIVKDKDGIILANLAPRLDSELKPSESFDTGTSINIDLSKAYEIELVLEQ